MIAKRGVRILRLLCQLEKDRIQRPAPTHSDMQGEGPSIIATNDTSYRYHRETGIDGDKLALDIHRLVGQVFSEQEVLSQQSSLDFREKLYKQNAAGQRPGSTLVVSSSPNMTLYDSESNNNWSWQDSAQDQYDLRRHTEEEVIATASGVQSRFTKSDSLEDILFLAQNGGPIY
jgi:hypothetical protein